MAAQAEHASLPPWASVAPGAEAQAKAFGVSAWKLADKDAESVALIKHAELQSCATTVKVQLQCGAELNVNIKAGAFRGKFNERLRQHKPSCAHCNGQDATATAEAAAAESTKPDEALVCKGELTMDGILRGLEVIREGIKEGRLDWMNSNEIPVIEDDIAKIWLGDKVFKETLSPMSILDWNFLIYNLNVEGIFAPNYTSALAADVTSGRIPVPVAPRCSDDDSEDYLRCSLLNCARRLLAERLREKMNDAELEPFVRVRLQLTPAGGQCRATLSTKKQRVFRYDHAPSYAPDRSSPYSFYPLYYHYHYKSHC